MIPPWGGGTAGTAETEPSIISTSGDTSPWENTDFVIDGTTITGLTDAGTTTPGGTDTGTTTPPTGTDTGSTSTDGWKSDDFNIEGTTITGFKNLDAAKTKLEKNGGKLTFPESINTIGSGAFKDIKELKSFEWGKISTVENDAFHGCGLEGKLEVPNQVVDIGYRAFQKNKLTEVVFQNDVGAIGPYAFADNLIEKVDLGTMNKIQGSRWGDGDATPAPELNYKNDGILSHRMFMNNKIRELNLENTKIWAIGSATFENNEFTEVKIPKNIKNIYSYAFRNNKNLKTVSFEKDVSSLQIDRAAFERCKISQINFPDEVGEMGGMAFLGNQLKEVVVPDGSILGFYIFSLNPLEKITFKSYTYGNSGKEPEAGTTSGIVRFTDTKTKEVTTLGEERTPLKNVLFKEYVLKPESTKFFSAVMFRNGMLKAIEAPYWITEVKKNAFWGNEGWHKKTKQVAIYRKDDKGNYVVTNDAKDGEQHVFNPVLLDVQIVDQYGNTLVPQKPVTIKRTRNGEIKSIQSTGGEDYTNFKLGDGLKIEFPDLGEKIKFKGASAENAGTFYQLSLSPEKVDTVAYGEGYEVGYKKATLKIEYEIPKSKPSRPKEQNPEEPKPEEPKPEEPKPEEPKPDLEVKPEIKPEPVPNPIPDNPRPAYPRNNVPDPNDPTSPSEITLIDENGVPLGNYIKQEKPDGTMEYVIMDEEVPLSAMLPTTDGTFAYEYYILGVALMSAGGLLMLRELGKRKNQK